jgi:hypothetical protein
MTWEQFLNFLRKEKEENIVYVLVYTKNNRYEFSQQEVKIILGRDEDTNTYTIDETSYKMGV